jgi:pyruvate kinase
MSPNNKNTKILATLGPAIADKEALRQLVNAGANIFRLNFSHGSHQDHEQRYRWVREIEEETGRPIGILMDLQGPKIRVGTFRDSQIELTKGNKFVLDNDFEQGDVNRVQLPHPEVIEALEPGMELLLDDGKIRLRVDACESDSVETTVVVGGPLSDRKGVNIPDAILTSGVLTEKDRDDLEFGLNLGVDWVALSFVQRPQDVEFAKELINGRASIMAKIEKPSAVEMIEDIVVTADGIMIARGDLGVEIPAEQVPSTQKRIIQECRKQGRPVVVATQMLESMRDAPTPTRAEVTDVANAVFEGADAVMLSAETASGRYPIEAVEMMSKIIRQVEADPRFRAGLDATHAKPEPTSADAISCAIRRISTILHIPVTINFTGTGSSSLRASRERPQAPILSLTRNLATARKLTVVWGINSVHDPDFDGKGDFVRQALDAAKRERVATVGDTVVITAGMPFGQQGSTNLLRIETIPA